MYIKQENESITLIGMPGAGKSTLGILLAKRIAIDFVDTDVLLQLALQEPLQSYLDREGHLALRKKERDILMETQFSNQVIATGGSVVYSDSLMQKFRQLGRIIYLDISYTTLLNRVNNADTRGIACPKEYSLEEVYHERQAMYRQYADITLQCDDMSLEDTHQALAKRLSSP